MKWKPYTTHRKWKVGCLITYPSDTGRRIKYNQTYVCKGNTGLLISKLHAYPAYDRAYTSTEMLVAPPPFALGK